MKKLFISLNMLFLALIAIAQVTTETNIATIKNTRITTYYEDDEMTIQKTRLDDQTLTYNFYDQNGNKTLESEYHFALNPFYYHTAYWYDNSNKLIADSTDYTKNFYGYYENGNLKYKTKYKTNTGLMSDSTYYEYENGNLVYEIIYGSSNEEKNRYRYTYENDVLTKREFITGKTSSGLEKISRRIEYSYNESGLLIEEVEYTLSTSTSSLGTIRSATRYQYQYDNLNRKTEQIYSEATASGGMLSSYTNKRKITYEYVENSNRLYKQMNHLWDPNNKIFVENDYSIYTYSQYNENKAPQNLKAESGETITQVKLSFDEPQDKEGINGYGLIINNKLHETIYESSPIILDKQVNGVHSYNVFAYYDTIPGNVSNQAIKVIDLNLPSPSNGRVLTQEYSSQWIVNFAFDAPEVPEGLNLTGYRYEVVGGNGGAKGTITPASNTKGTFKMYYLSNDVEKNLVTLNLYAVYEEGESAPYSFDIDLRDTKNQIVAHWHNQHAEKYSYNEELNSEEPVSLTNYYYSSSNTSNTETLIASVENIWDNETYSYMPKYRTIDNMTEIWNPETMQWCDYKTIEQTRSGSEMEYQIINSTLIFDEESQSFMTTEKKIDHYYYDDSTSPYTLIHDWTKNYKIENGEEIYLNYVKHSTEENNRIETIYDTDQTTILQKIEYINNSDDKIARINTYNYINEEYKLASYTENEYDFESGLLTKTSTYSESDGAMKLDNIIYNTGSKEYHYTKAPFGLSYKNETLKWYAPSTEGVIPTTYKVFVNNVLYTETNETSATIEGIPSGKYNFTVMCTFDGFESSLSIGLDVNFVNHATFIPEVVNPTPYDAELDNSVADLSTVTLTFPNKIASLAEGAEAYLNSRFMTYPATAAISEDGMSVVFTLPSDLENGMYVLDIPSKMINSEDGTYNPALNYTFTLLLPLTTDLPEPTPNPAEGIVSELSKIELTFDRDVFALESAIDVTGYVYAEDANGNKTDAKISIEGWDYTKWIITFVETINAYGKYTIVIPEAIFGDSVASQTGWTGAFTSGKVNPEIKLNYTIKDSSVDSINNDNIIIEGNNIIAPEDAKVFNATGYMVSPNNLQPGVYVVVFNNQSVKVLIK